MEEIAISKFKATCLEVLERVRRTRRPILVTRFGEPVAEVTPPSISSTKGRRLGAMVGTARIKGDIVSPAGNLDDDIDSWVSRTLAQTPVREAPLTNDVALEVPRMRFSHRDPADHFIAASAKVFDLTLVTADPRLLSLKSQGLAILASR